MPAPKANIADFLLTLAREWGALVSGSFSVPFTILGFLTERDYQQKIWWGMAFLALLLAFFLDRTRNKMRIEELEKRLLPKIRLFLHPDQTSKTAGVEIASGPGGEELPYIQVSAAALTDAMIYEPVANITRIEHRADPSHKFAEVWGESRVVPWSRQSERTTPSKGNPLRFLVSYDPRTPTPQDIVALDQQSNRLIRFYSATGRNGEYRYTVHVVGRDVIPAMAHVSVTWRSQGYPTVTLEPIKQLA